MARQLRPQFSPLAKMAEDYADSVDAAYFQRLARKEQQAREEAQQLEVRRDELETVRDRGLLADGSVRVAAIARAERALFRLPDRVIVDSAAHGALFARESLLIGGTLGNLLIPMTCDPAVRLPKFETHAGRGARGRYRLRRRHASGGGLQPASAGADGVEPGSTVCHPVNRRKTPPRTAPETPGPPGRLRVADAAGSTARRPRAAPGPRTGPSRCR